MSKTSDARSEEFLKISGQFSLGALVTESSHPVTANLSDVAKRDVAEALDLLFQVDGDVLAKYGEFVQSGRAGEIERTLLHALNRGGRLFFTGCGSTGRLSILLVSIWREFWQRQRVKDGSQESKAPNGGPGQSSPSSERARTSEGAVSRSLRSAVAEDFENRAFSVMAGGDFALIKSVEGFEDFTAFGKKQLGDCGVCAGDVVFAITEGGETPFVIGTAWKGVEVGAKVYFVYNNPDAVLCRHVQRSREIIEDARVEKINLTTGPMAIGGSTRMQATTIQLCVLLTVLEMLVRDLVRMLEPDARREAAVLSVPIHTPVAASGYDAAAVPAEFLRQLTEMHATLRSPQVLSPLAELVLLEESVYGARRKNTYYADRFGIDVLTDTTERSPTYGTPPFRKFDDPAAAESWSFLFVPDAKTWHAWKRILKREPLCVGWLESDVRELVGQEKAASCNDTIRRVGCRELMRFKIGLDGLPHRRLQNGDSAIGILSEKERESFLEPTGFQRVQLAAAKKAGARIGLIYFGTAESGKEISRSFATVTGQADHFLESSAMPGSRLPPTLASSVSVLVPVPKSSLLLDGVARAGVKMVLNALSTCTMVRLGRVLGNTMVCVVPSNLKLIDRATRYIQNLAGVSYEQANRLLFEVLEYVEPRMKADRACPPVVGLAAVRARHKLTNEEAEKRLELAL